MFVNYVLNGRGYGPLAEDLQSVGWDHGYLRPYIDDYGRRCVTINTGRKVQNQKTGRLEMERKKVLISDLMRRGVWNNTWNASPLRIREWIELDRQAVKSFRLRTTAWNDVMSRNRIGGFDAMARLTYEYEAQSDPHEAIVDMEGLADGRQDSALYKLRSIPLPITYSQFYYGARRLAVSANSGTPSDQVSIEAASTRVGEMVEKTLIGTETGITFLTNSTGVGAHDGTSTVYGYTNFPYRITKTDLNTPTGSNPEAVKQDVIEMRELARAQGIYGPFALYLSSGYEGYLDDDYFRSGGTSVTRTLRERISGINGIVSVQTLDFLTTGFQMILVSLQRQNVSAIDGMPIRVVRWEGRGGMRQDYLVMCIQVPLLQAAYNGVAGVVHATTS